jgi:hypothetical protein
MIDFIIQNSGKILVAVTVASGIIGWLCREWRREPDNKIILDAFSGSTIYSTFYVVAILWFLDEKGIGPALAKQSDLLSITFGAVLVYFIKEYIDDVIRGVHSQVPSGQIDDTVRGA